MNVSVQEMHAVERRDMEKRPYAILEDSLIYAQVCTGPDIAFAVGAHVS